MYSALAIALSISGALAAPATLKTRQSLINFSITNDHTGASAPSTIAADGQPINFGATFGSSVLAKEGRVFATSAHLTSNFQGADCMISDENGHDVSRLNERKTFAELDGVEGAAVETDVTDLYLTCSPPAVRKARQARQIQFPTVTISVINDKTGLRGDAQVITDGTFFDVTTLFAGTDIDADGTIFASSAQLTDLSQATALGFKRVACSFNNGNKTFAINTDKTFVDLDGNPAVAIPQDLTGFTFQCQV